MKEIVLGLFNKTYVFADLFQRFFLALIESDFIFFKQIPSLRIDRYNQRTKSFDTAVPQRFRHTEILPLGIDDFLHLGCGYNSISSRNTQ